MAIASTYPNKSGTRPPRPRVSRAPAPARTALVRRPGVPPEVPDLWAVAGGKGGVGKSVIASNLALAAARRGLRVLIVDADLGGGNQHTLFGMDSPRTSLDRFIEGDARSLAEVAVATKHRGLSLISSRNDLLGAANPKFLQKKKLVRHLMGAPVDVLVIDLGAGTAFNTLDLFLAARVQLVVTTPEPTAVQNAYGFIKCAGQRGTDDVETMERFAPRLIVNCAGEADAKRVFDTISTATGKFLRLDMSLAGSVRRDAVVPTSVAQATPLMALSPSCACARDIDAIAAHILDESFVDAARSGTYPGVTTTGPAVRGLNEDIVHNGKVFHIQTEDLGAEKSQVRSQVFQGGCVVFTKVTPHGASLKKGVTMTTAELMSFQHRALGQAIRAGRLA